MVDHVLGFHHTSLGAVELKVGFHHESLRVVKLEVGLAHQCSSSDQKVFCSNEASDEASPWES